MKPRLTGSIALRVMMINTIFLVIPLIFYSFYSFARDEVQTVAGIFTSLKVMRDSQVHFVEESVAAQDDFMLLLHDLIVAESREGGRLSADGVAKILRGFADREQISAILYVEPDASGNFICQSSTKTEFVGQNFSDWIDFPKLMEKGEVVFVAKDPIHGMAQYVMRPVGPGPQSHGNGAILTITSINLLLKRLEQMPTLDSSSIVILSREMKVLAAGDDALVGLTFSFDKESKGDIFLDEERELVGSYHYELDERHYLAVIGSPKGASIYLLFETPRDLALRKVYIETGKIFVLFLVIIIAGGLFSLILTRRMAQPLESLLRAMEGVSKGDLKLRAPIDRYGFEINFLIQGFNDTLDALIAYIDQVQKEKVQKELLEKELAIGHQIQMSILPKAFPVISKMEVASAFVPAKEVGGDFYDCFALPSGRVLLVIADASGKGISACLYSLGIRSTLRSLAVRDSALLSIAESTNTLFSLDTGESGMFVTLWMGIFDPQSGELEYTSMGHPPAFLLREGKTIPLTTFGVPMGVSDHPVIEVKKERLLSGDLLVLYTDGISEATAFDESMYGLVRFEEFLKGCNEKGPQKVIEDLFVEIQKFVGAAAQHDDMTLLMVKIKN